MSLALISLSDAGARVARKVSAKTEAEVFLHDAVSSTVGSRRFSRLADLVNEIFFNYHGLIFIAPCGAVVRVIAPHLRHKTVDPAVVVVDVGARYAVSLLSGHEGGANQLAVDVANILGAEPIVTTTSDALKNLIVGVGCRRGASAQSIERAIRAALDEADLSLSEVRFIASADIKADEKGLRDTAAALGVPLRLIPSDEIRACQREFSTSDVAQRYVNLKAVAEPAALLAGRRTRLVLSRRIWESVTVAIAREEFEWSESAREIRWTERGEQRTR